MHDFDAQRQDTFNTFETLSASFAIPETIALDIHFFGEDDADSAGAEAALQAAGHAAEVDDEFKSIEVTLELDDPSAERIWEVERRITELLLPFGFTPDGWGFPLPEPRGFLAGLTAKVSGIFGRA